MNHLGRLIEAAKSDNTEQLETLLRSTDYREFVNESDDVDSYTPLIWAAKDGKNNAVDMLCKNRTTIIDKCAGWVSKE